MTIVADTFDIDTDLKSVTSDFQNVNLTDLSHSFGYFSLKTQIVFNDVLVSFSAKNIDANFSEKDLTRLSIESSESAFSELWRDEDDDYWGSY